MFWLKFLGADVVRRIHTRIDARQEEIENLYENVDSLNLDVYALEKENTKLKAIVAELCDYVYKGNK